MKKQYLLFLGFLILVLLRGNASFAQMVGTDVFLQGRWIECGEDRMGAFGTCTSPLNYHAHPCCGLTPFTAGTNLDVVYDWGHDGWSVGLPAEMGDYTIPGYPQEGWSIQVGATEYRNWAGGGICTGPFTVPGGISGYTNVAGNKTGTFNGNVAGIHVVQVTHVDTLASWVIVTTRMYNTTGGALTVWYERTCDPDNTSFWNGTPLTMNVVVHQNEDARHDVMVSAYGNTAAFGGTPAYNRTNSYMALCTKDCRAKCGYLGSFGGLFPSTTPSGLWGGGGLGTVLHDSTYTDVGIWLVFNVGSIAAGDSAVVSYAYVYNGNDGIDSAFPDPAAMTTGPGGSIAYPPLPFPGVVTDTYNACAFPGVTVIPVDLLGADSTTWTWSRWTWSPGTGLSATTGTHVTVTTTGLPAYITYTVTGTDAATCCSRTMYITFIACNNVRANSPCYGDTLFLRRVGDSTGCTYYWWSPGSGFTSTLQDPFIYPATYPDSTKFYVKRTVLGISDTDSISVTIHYKPVVTATNNGPLCDSMTDTLQLGVSPGMAGMTYSWTGPSVYTSVIQNPTRTPYTDADTGIYTVYVASPFGCKDTATTFARMIKQPPKPIITDTNYCQGMPFTAYTVSGLNPGATVYWWSAPTGGSSSTLAPTVPTTFPGLYIVWASQKVGSCESTRGTDTVRVITTPPAPIVTGPMAYCQYKGPIDTLTVIPADSAKWWNAAIGGSFLGYTEPLPSILVPGATNYWVSRVDSGCEGPRTPVTITVHPKPSPPIVTPTPWCQFRTPGPIVVTVSGAGDVPTFYGPGITPPLSSPPVPPTSVAPDTILYYITETTVFGCVSDSSIDKVVIKLKPQPPVTHDRMYCQGALNPRPLNEQVDSDFNSHLNWYQNANALPPIPVPNTNLAPGTTTWWVSQTEPNNATGCESDSAAVNVTLIYKPVFNIQVSQPWVCQYDSITMWYHGPGLFEPLYQWTLPQGAMAVNGTSVVDSFIMVQFDSTDQNNYVMLRASDDSGFCYTDDTIRIRVIPKPTMIAYSKPDVCLGDTVQLALTMRSNNAYDYKWYVDNIVMTSSTALNIVSSNSNDGGPYTISWTDTGRHIIRITSTTQEGCKSDPTFDSVLVHNIPDPSFFVSSNNPNGICLEDSVEFTATTIKYNNSYEWSPAHDFNNINKPVIWGKMEENKSVITLKVTDPFGCFATKDMEIDPSSCCTILFPNAFTPNGTGPQDNNLFKPYFVGYHRFHMFRIVNRWGQTVFESANSSVMAWDGNYNGVPQDMGVYYYFLKYDCGGKTMEAKGDVTLIR